MACCEKCWRDAGGDAKRYTALVEARKPHPCTPEEQAGEFRYRCDVCGRLTMHQWTHVCMVPGCAGGAGRAE